MDMNKITYKSNHNVVYFCKYHVVWCPKYLRKVLVNGLDIRLKNLIKSIATEIQVDIIEMEKYLSEAEISKVADSASYYGKSKV